MPEHRSTCIFLATLLLLPAAVCHAEGLESDLGDPLDTLQGFRFTGELYVLEQPCHRDFDGNGEVNGTALSKLLGFWGQGDVPQDIDGDGLVAGSDLTLLLAHWRPCRDDNAGFRSGGSVLRGSTGSISPFGTSIGCACRQGFSSPGCTIHQ